MEDDRYRRVEHWQDSEGRARDLGQVWTLRKGRRQASCVLRGHPLGIEACILVDGDVRRTETFRTAKDMIDATADWCSRFEAKGWQGSD